MSKSLTAEAYVERVVKVVTLRLKDENWFQGVCLDTINANWASNAPLHEAIQEAELDTMYWDAPNMGF